MKKHLLKTMLTALILLMGGVNGAWAAKGDVTTNVDIDFSNPITGTYSIAGAVGSMTWTGQWTMVPNVTDGILRFGNFSGGIVELQNNNIRSKDVVTISFDMAFGKLNNKHVGFELRDADNNSLLTQWFDAYNGDFDDNNPLNLNWDYMYHANNTVLQERCVYFTIRINYDEKTITTNTRCLMSGSGKPATDGEFSASWSTNTPIAKFVLTGNINNTERYSTFDNLKITTTEGDYSAATADYTVKFMCGNTEIKDAVTLNGDVDADATLLDAHKQSFTTTDATKRYIYVSDDADGKTIAEDGSTVVTVTFREAEKWAYTITSSVDGTTLPYTATDSVWEDQNVITVPYPRYQANGTILVEKNPNGNDLQQNITVTNNGVTVDLPYTAVEGVDNLYLLSEAENLETTLPKNATTFTSRVSNGLIIHGAKGDLLTLPAGKYKFTLGTIGGDNSSHMVNYVVYKEATPTEEGAEHNADNIIIEGTCTGNFFTSFTSDEFEINKQTTISFTCSDPASNRGIDLVYVQKTGLSQVEIALADAKTMAQDAIHQIEEADWNGLSDSQKKDLEYFVAEFTEILNTETATAEQVEDMKYTIYKRKADITNLLKEAQDNVDTAMQNLKSLIEEAEGAYEDGKVGSEALATAIADANAAYQTGKYNDMLAAADTLKEKLDAYIAANTETGVVSYVKVTDTDDITDGDYLIVYEAGNVALDGASESLNEANNTVSVTIEDGKIAPSEEIDAAVVTIDVENGTIKSSKGLYIGTDENKKLKTSENATTYTNSFAIVDGNALISANGISKATTLQFNNATDQNLFRYYQSNQQPIQLYKKVTGGDPTPITVATPTFDPAETTEEFEAAFGLTMACDTKDAVIHYTLDGTEPTAESPVYDTPINIVKTTTVKAIAIYKGLSSDLATATYTFKTSEVYYEKVTSTANITAGEYLIVYEDGNVAFNAESGSLNSNNTVAVVFANNGILSSEETDAAAFTIDPSAKSIKTSSGKYIGINSNSNTVVEVDETYQHDVIIIDKDYNVVISKTIDSKEMTLKFNNGSTCFRYYKPSSTGMMPIQLYKKVTPAPVITVVTPTFSLVGGEYTEAQTVTLNCETEGATIYYTTNGDDPTTESTQYNTEDPITVSETTTIKAIAVLNGVESKVAEATYTIIPPVTTVNLAITKLGPAYSAYDLNSTSPNNLHLHVQNNGNEPASNFIVNYYKNDDTVPFRTIDWSNPEENLSPIPAGMTQKVDIRLEEYITTPGEYRLRAELVCENDITPDDNSFDGGLATFYIPGDANVNGEVTTSDAVAAVSYVLKIVVPNNVQMLSADVDKTNNITVADAQAIVNIALNYEFESEARGAEAGVNYLTMENSGIGLVNTTGFSAFQMDVTLSDGAVLNAARLTERAAGMLLMTNKVGLNTWRIAALSLDGSTISGSEGSLLNLDIAGQGSVSVSNVEFVDRAARAYKLGLGTPTAIDALYNNKVDGEVYTVSGARSNGLKKGVNVVRQADGSVRKMLVK